MLFLKLRMFSLLLLLFCVPYSIASSENRPDFINKSESLPKSAPEKAAISTSLRKVSEDNFNILKDIAKFAYASYCPKFENSTSYTRTSMATAQNEIRDEFKLISVVNDRSTSTTGFIALNKVAEVIIVSFRGTKKKYLNNWLTNIQFKLESSSPIGPREVLIHGGFKKAYMAVRERILNTLENSYRENPDYSIIFTGHSLGGALATLAALDVTYNTKINKDVLHLVTFGQPRTGGKRFSEYFSTSKIRTMIRIVNHADIVPHVPPRVLGYRHQDSELWYVHKKLLRCSKGEDERCSLSLKRSSLTINDHSIYLGVKKTKELCISFQLPE